jgi:hypothetical protein
MSACSSNSSTNAVLATAWSTSATAPGREGRPRGPGIGPQRPAPLGLRAGADSNATWVPQDLGTAGACRSGRGGP